MPINSEDTERTETLDAVNGQSEEDKLFAEAWDSVTSGTTYGEKSEEASKVETSEDPEQPAQQEAQEDNSSSWLDSLPEEAKQQFQALLNERDSLQHNYRSLHNRLAPTQRKVTELQRRLQELQATPQTQPAPSVDVSPSKEEPKPKSELWSRVKESDPVLADAIEEMLAAERERLQEEFDSRLRPVQERTQEEDLQRETQRLLELVPNAVEVFTSPLYSSWLEMQPESIQKLHESPKHQDALALMRLFDSDVARFEMQYGQQQQTAQPAQPSNTADKVAQRRQEKLSKPIPQVARPAAAEYKEEDAEALFAKLYDEQLKQASPQYGLKLRS